MRGAATVVACLLCTAVRPAAAKGSTEITDPDAVKRRFSKKAITQTTAIGYLPTQAAVDAYNAVAAKMQPVPDGGIPWYHIRDRAALDKIGLVGKQPVVALHRPWAPSKKFKVTYKGDLASPAFSDWVMTQAFAPIPFFHKGMAAHAEKAANRQNKAVLRGWIHTYVPDPASKKPADWDSEPKEIKDPRSEMPDDWDEAEDGAWSTPMVPNPKYNGEWKPAMMNTLLNDSTDVRPEDWDQPEEIPERGAAKPADWDDEEDGAWVPTMVPNPAFKGVFMPRMMPREAEVKAIADKLRPALEKYGRKLIATVEDNANPHGVVGLGGGYDWTYEDYTSGRAITLEEPKQMLDSSYKATTGYKRFKYPGTGSVEEWVEQWAAGKLKDLDRIERMAKKEERIKREKEEAEKKKAGADPRKIAVAQKAAEEKPL